MNVRLSRRLTYFSHFSTDPVDHRDARGERVTAAFHAHVDLGALSELRARGVELDRYRLVLENNSPTVLARAIRAGYPLPRTVPGTTPEPPPPVLPAEVGTFVLTFERRAPMGDYERDFILSGTPRRTVSERSTAPYPGPPIQALRSDHGHLGEARLIWNEPRPDGTTQPHEILRLPFVSGMQLHTTLGEIETAARYALARAAP